MGVLATYLEAQQAYRERQELAVFEGKEPNQVAAQLRIDISPVGVGVATATEGQFRFISFYATENYEGSISRAAHEIVSSPFLKPGVAAVLTFWPDEMRHEEKACGTDQAFASSEEADQKLLTSPDSFQLDSAFSYRALKRPEGQVFDCIGLKLTGWQPIQEALPRGVLLGRYWGALAALEVIMGRFKTALPLEGFLLEIADATQVYYFKFQKGALAGVRVSSRESFHNCRDLEYTLQHFGMVQHTEIYLVDLSASSVDADLFCQKASERGFSMNLVTREDLVSSFEVFESLGHQPFFPIALLQGGFHG